MVIGLILLVLAFVLAVVAASGLTLRGWHLGWIAVACFFLYLLLGGVTLHALH